MKFFKNVLSPSLLSKVENDLLKKQKEYSWSINHFLWEKELLSGSYGLCVQTFVDQSVKNDIIGEIKEKLPSFNHLSIQHFVWFPGSSISKHNDSTHKFGCTIYLNHNWEPNFGGLFIFQDKNSANVIVPEFNTMLLNDEKESHMVTNVSFTTLQPRITLQIWGD